MSGERVDEGREPDVMDQRWACLTCNWSGRFGRLKSYPAGYIGCPVCKSDTIHPADGQVVEVPEYHGPIGTRN